jgi:hypothetical protein
VRPLRPTVYGTRHAISVGHYLAASAGFAGLEVGGMPWMRAAPLVLRLPDGRVETIALDDDELGAAQRPGKAQQEERAVAQAGQVTMVTTIVT